MLCTAVREGQMGLAQFKTHSATPRVRILPAWLLHAPCMRRCNSASRAIARESSLL